jgi:predicted transcriptional regulator
MTPQELREARHALGLSCRRFAEVTGVCDGRMVRRYEAGDTPVNPVLAVLVRVLMGCSEARRIAGLD